MLNRAMIVTNQPRLFLRVRTLRNNTTERDTSMRLEHKIAIVSGGGTGIGEAIAKVFVIV